MRAMDSDSVMKWSGYCPIHKGTTGVYIQFGTELQILSLNKKTYNLHEVQKLMITETFAAKWTVGL